MSRRWAIALVGLLLPTAGCLGDFMGAGGSATNDEVGGPGFHVRSTDFYWSYGTWGEDFRDAYDWPNPEGEARVEARHKLSAGSVHVEFHDANGSVVWSHDFTPESPSPQDFHMGTGSPGTWTVVIERDGARGQLDVHAWRVLREGTDDGAGNSAG